MFEKKNFVFTSESVSEGHPDKVCDGISDAILDAYLKRDAYARVAVETLTTTNTIVIAGEVRSTFPLSHEEIEHIAREKVRKIGYEQEGFHWKNLECLIKLHNQSVDIAVGVDAADHKDEGAGDQGLMFGYATSETNNLMPAPIDFSHRLLKKLADDRHSGKLPMLAPDAKSQFSIQYQDGKPIKATSVVLSTQHIDGLSQGDIQEIIKPYIEEILPQGWLPEDKELYINPTGRFVIGGPDGDAGLTGRKIVVDTYGGAAPHGGGAFSGKDPTKVDRSAAYAMRYLAKNIVAANLAERVTLQVSYAIGVSHPLSLFIDTHGTGRVDEEKLVKILPEIMNLTSRGIREHLNLNHPIYERTSAYGHFGRTPEADGGFSWEKTDLVDDLKNAFNF